MNNTVFRFTGLVPSMIDNQLEERPQEVLPVTPDALRPHLLGRSIAPRIAGEAAGIFTRVAFAFKRLSTRT